MIRSLYLDCIFRARCLSLSLKQVSASVVSRVCSFCSRIKKLTRRPNQPRHPASRDALVSFLSVCVSLAYPLRFGPQGALSVTVPRQPSKEGFLGLFPSAAPVGPMFRSGTKFPKKPVHVLGCLLRQACSMKVRLCGKFQPRSTSQVGKHFCPFAKGHRAPPLAPPETGIVGRSPHSGFC